MKPVLAPTTDVNSETYKIVAWHVNNRSYVTKGEYIADIETSKAVFEVNAPADGVLLFSGDLGMEIPTKEPLAFQFSSESELFQYEKELKEKKDSPKNEKKSYRATVKAEKLAQEHNIDLASLNHEGLITQKDVEAVILSFQPLDISNLPNPLKLESKVEERILLIGGGMGATQVIDILRDHPSKGVVAIVDEKREKWGQEIYGVPVVGNTNRLEQLFEQKSFDSIIIAISTSIQARTKYYNLCNDLNIPLANAIDKTAKVAVDSKIGRGNVICAFCHIGTNTVIGDNNFISAYNSFDHHSEIGSHISTGPACITSARVKINDRVRLGTGIFIEPYLELGEDVQVASGAVILKSIPSKHAVKTRIITTSVVPLKG